MAQTKKKAGWPQIGTLRKGNDGGNYIKIADNVKIFVDGVEIAFNKNRVVQLQDPRSKVEMLRDKGFIDEAEADRRLEKLADMAWLRYELVCPPPRD